MKRNILLGKKVDTSDLLNKDDEDEEDEDDLKKWGKKKTYWTGDTADLEIGQEMEDAEAEEEAARELQQQKSKRMKAKDFRDDLDEEDDEDEEEEENHNTYGSKLSKKKDQKKVAPVVSAKKNKAKTDKIAKELEAMMVDNQEMGSVQTEHLSKDISGFTKDQKLELVRTTQILHILLFSLTILIVSSSRLIRPNSSISFVNYEKESTN
jgi:signal recognition particle GTPase